MYYLLFKKSLICDPLGAFKNKEPSGHMDSWKN